MNKEEIKRNYNIDKIVTAKELVSLSRTYKDNLETIIVMMNKKRKEPSKIDLLIKEFRSFKIKMEKVIKCNNLKIDNNDKN